MEIFRYTKNNMLYTITTNGRGGGYKAHPYNHKIEIGVKFTSHSRFRDFTTAMSLDDFTIVSES
jgi:hypothetical protein